MPAPSSGQIQVSLTAAFLAAGYVKRIIQNGIFVTVPGQLPDQMVTFIKAIANGDNDFWVIWQATQVVSPLGIPVPMNVSAVPVTGTGILP